MSLRSETDQRTKQYFDMGEFEYSTGRLWHVVEAIRRRGSVGASLVDIGCGRGNVLKYIKDTTGLATSCGLDVAPNCVATTEHVAKSEGLVGSILDDRFVAGVAREFEFALMAAVLHHLVGRTRRESTRLAIHAIANALRLVRPGGLLLICEPLFYPRVVMDSVFYVKRVVSTFTRNRVSIGGIWNNIGPPVVSYYGLEELEQMIGCVEGCDIVEKYIDVVEVTRMMRLFGISKRQDVTLLLKKNTLVAQFGRLNQ